MTIYDFDTSIAWGGFGSLLFSFHSQEYGGKWKAVHYLARNFFANTALSAYNDSNFLTVYSISDNVVPLNSVTLVVSLFLIMI